MRRLLPLPLLLLALTQCRGDLSPYQTVPVTLNKTQQQAITVGDTPASTIGICYNTLTTTAAEVHALAVQACGTETVPQALERDFRLSACPVLLPARVTFACLPKPSQP